MLHPNAPYGDVTIYTHAVAAGLLRPLGGNATEVSHNFGNYLGKSVPAWKSSAVTGAAGLYGLYADAYRRAERDVLPRKLRSITWEAVPGLFPDVFKAQQRNVAAIDQMVEELPGEAVDHSTALEEMLLGCFGIDDLRLLPFPLAILLGQVGHGLEGVGLRPGRIFDARRGVGENPHLIISGATAPAGRESDRRPQVVRHSHLFAYCTFR
jgi:hypothetical protein